MRQGVPGAALEPALLFSLVPGQGEQLTPADTTRHRTPRPPASSRPGGEGGHCWDDLSELQHQIRAAPLGWTVLLAQMPAARSAPASARKSASEGSGPCA